MKRKKKKNAWVSNDPILWRESIKILYILTLTWPFSFNWTNVSSAIIGFFSTKTEKNLGRSAITGKSNFCICSSNLKNSSILFSLRANSSSHKYMFFFSLFCLVFTFSYFFFLFSLFFFSFHVSLFFFLLFFHVFVSFLFFFFLFFTFSFFFFFFFFFFFSSRFLSFFLFLFLLFFCFFLFFSFFYYYCYFICFLFPFFS